MKEQLQLLERLQEIDNQIDRHEKDLARVPLEVQDIARNLVVIRREISEIEERLGQVQKDLRKKEGDLSTEQEKIKRSERRLLNIKNQKEHNALSREVKLGKKVVGEIEDAILDYMGQVETLTKSLERKRNDYQDFEKRLHEKKAEAREVESSAGTALTSLNSEKLNVSEAIEGQFLKRYTAVKKARGKAVAELKNGSCTGCNMAIPPQLNIKVLKQEEMVICPNCNRILFVKPENIPEHNKLEA
ncbi:MAG: C4-type zinc ribbon domain-containing protein [Desulfomonilaceae bacterium]|nr:C4-type zinc ribbon domain-containing protein [Desulfomonilaceae bacterium]